MAKQTINFRVDQELADRLPDTKSRRKPDRTDFIIAALKEKFARMDKAAARKAKKEGAQ